MVTPNKIHISMKDTKIENVKSNFNSSRPLVKSEYQFFSTYFQPKHMLWVLQRTVSLRRFFEHPKHMLKPTGKKILTILAKKFCSSKPVQSSQITANTFKIMIFLIVKASLPSNSEGMVNDILVYVIIHTQKLCMVAVNVLGPELQCLLKVKQDLR